MPEVPSSPKATSQMSAGRLSLRDALITKLLKKYSPVRRTREHLVLKEHPIRDKFHSKSSTTKRMITLFKRWIISFAFLK